MLEYEKRIGMFNEKSWERFAENVIKHKKALIKELKKLKKLNKKIAVYGASGKGQTLLQFCGIDKRFIEYIVDKSKMKQGKLSPGTHIKIYPPEHIYEDSVDVILLCAWNWADEIIKQEKRFKELGGKFLHPLPMPHYI